MTADTTTAKTGYKVVGTRPVRHDGVDKVTGRALYGADTRLPGMLWGKVLRSPHAHARIVSIDASRAEAHPDVAAVVTFADLPRPEDTLAEVGEDQVMSQKYLSNNVIADDKALYKGHAVAAVAASSPHAAEEALGLIDVCYDVLPPVTNAEDALAPGAPILHEHITAPEGFGGEQDTGTNATGHVQHVLGDIAKGFAEADVVIEREFRTRTVHQGYIEPQNATALWGEDGKLTVWCSSQGHFGIRDQMSAILDVPVSQIRVVPMEIGGGFGGKLRVYLEPVAALLSKKSGAPVKMVMTRAEVLEATGPTSGGYVKVKMGATNDGRITAAYAYFALEAGAYPGAPVGGAAACILTPYDIENVMLDGVEALTNKPATAAYRAPGSPIVTYAVEAVVDEIAHQLDMEPVEFRILNAAKEGTRRADGTLNPPIGALEVMEAVRDHPSYSAPLSGPNEGRGVAIGFWRNNTGPAAAVANVLPDGRVSLIEGSVDIGGTRTAIAQHLAESLGIPVEDVSPQVGDTDTIGYTSVTGGSGVVFKSGMAALEAADDIKRQMEERAALLWEASDEEVEYTDGAVRHRRDPELQITFRDLAAQLNDTGGPVVGRGNVNPTGVGGSFAANIVDVRVDPETGKVDVLRYIAVQDVGVAVHPSYVEGQMQGGAAQGAGWALNEEYFMSDDGALLNDTLLDYRMPTSLDLPMIETVIVEVPNPGHPYGVRGVGEANIVPPLAAFANAVNDAVGARMRQLPMSPAAIVAALSEDGKA